MLLLVALAAFAAAEPIGGETWLTSLDYDDLAVPTAMQDTVRVALTADAAGNVVRCQPVLIVNSSVVAHNVCKFLRRRARFKPATEADGRPVAAMWTGSFRLLRPGGGGPPALPARFDRVTTLNRLPSGPAFPLTRIAQLYSAEGRPESCQVVEPSGSRQLDALACATTAETPAPLADAANRPMRAVVLQTILFVAEPSAPRR